MSSMHLVSAQRQHAAAERKRAEEAAHLPNVRERHLRSAEALEALSHREERALLSAKQREAATRARMDLLKEATA